MQIIDALKQEADKLRKQADAINQAVGIRQMMAYAQAAKSPSRAIQFPGE